MNPCPCGNFNDTQNPVRVLLLSLPNIKNGFQVPCSIELTSILKCHVWITKISAMIGQGIRPHPSAPLCKLRGRDSASDSRRMACLTSSETRTCAGGEIRQYCKLQAEGQSLMRAARAYHRILKLARTIADLTGCEEIGSAHLAEAL